MPIAQKHVQLIENMELIYNKTIDRFGFDEFQELFGEINCSSVSFKNVKTQLKVYIKEKYGGMAPSLEVLESIQYIDLNMSANLNLKYFGSFETLKNEIDRLIVGAADGCIGRFDSVRAALYLAWAGLTRNEAINLKKKEVLDDEDCLVVDGNKVEVNPILIKFLRQYKTADFFELPKKGSGQGITRQGYILSDYLLRNHKSAKYNGTGLSRLIGNFGLSTQSQNRLSYNNIFISGVYYKIYSHESEYKMFITHSDRETISKYEKLFKRKFNGNLGIMELKRLLDQYQEWKKCFYE